MATLSSGGKIYRLRMTSILSKIRQRIRIENRKINIRIAAFNSYYNQKLWEYKNVNTQKIFCIGNNKTGTTSLKTAMSELGYKIGDQRAAEALHNQWALRNFNPIIEYCKTAEFFQDIPFSKPYTFIALDQAFPNSKFILTIRDDSEQWYNSLTNFHSKLWGKDGRLPTKDDLQNSTFIKKGMPWEIINLGFTSPDNNPYQKDILIQSYVDYNNSVIEYFRHRPKDLLVINVGQPGGYQKLCEFIGKPVTSKEFPWVNKT